MKNFKFKKRKQSYMDKPSYDTDIKSPEKEGSVNDKISIVSLRDMPKSSYSIKADPFTAASNVSRKYPFLAPFNKAVSAHYSGEDNIDGGNVQQYSTSVTSRFLDAIDTVRLQVDLNYLFAPIHANSNQIGYGLVDEMRRSIAEAVSILKATTFTSLAIGSFVVETDMVMGSATTTTVAGKSVYTNITDVLYAMSMYYQIFWQEVLSTFNWHNSFRKKQGTMIRNSWNRETPILNALFGLFNKKAFLNLIEGIALSFEGEYIDKAFESQMQALTALPSRRSDSMFDPVLELQASMNHPQKFKVYVLSGAGNSATLTPIFDDADLKLNNVSFWDACESIKDYLSLEGTTYWARQAYKTGEFIVNADNIRYNAVKGFFDVITACITRFKPAWADYRECIDIVTRTGVVGWYKGYIPAVTQDTDGQLFTNLIVDDIYKMILSGPDSLQYNDATKRWQTFTHWNMYTGVPAYDLKQGGCFITFSSKNFTGDFTTTESIPYIPVMFDPNATASSVYAEAVTRSGTAIQLSYDVINIRDNEVLGRLAPLASQSDLSMRVPVVLNYDVLTLSERSMLYRMLTQIFSMCKITHSTKVTVDEEEVDITVDDYSLDPDLVCIYQIEISDITNVMIAYAKANGPFRGTSDSLGTIIGFSSIT